MQTLLYKVIFSVNEHIEVADEFITSGNPHLTRFFIFTTILTPRSTKTADLGGKKTQWES